MRPMGIAAAAVGACLLAAGPVWGGVYNSQQPVAGPSPNKAGVVKPLPFEPFRLQLVDLIKIGIPETESKQRTDYLTLREELQKKERAGTATVADRVNLGACLLRLNEPVQAIEVLRQATVLDRRNFQAAANLATAYQMAGEWTPAFSSLRNALDLWPAEAAGLSPQQLAWYKRAEEYHLKLIRARAREALGQLPGQQKPPTTVDDLFGVRFVGPSGKYEAGQLDPAEQQKLPPDAVAIVQQLLIWLPQDTRLYWLLGELLNARGDVIDADKVFAECVDARRFNVAELREHRRIVKEARETAAREGDGPTLQAGNPDTSGDPGGTLPDSRKILVVGGLIGLVVVGLGYLQVREMRRRRRGAAPLSKEC